MRGLTLNRMLDDLRAEIGHSTNVAHGLNARDSLVRTLVRTQERLWEEWDWPHLKVYREIQLLAGVRYYSVPADMTFERIFPEDTVIRYGDQWYQMDYGIDPVFQFREYDSDRGDRGWPCRRWDVAEDTDETSGLVDAYGMIEVWPIPSTNGRMKIRGVRSLNTPVDGSDRFELDGNLVVLFAAAELLARQKAVDAEAKGAQAAALFQRIKSQGSKGRRFTMGGGVPNQGHRRPLGPPLPQNPKG